MACRSFHDRTGLTLIGTLLSQNGVTFEWINPKEHREGRVASFIGQEVEEMFPN